MINSNLVRVVKGKDLNWAKILEAEEEMAVAENNLSTMSWICPPGVRTVLRSRPKVPNFPDFLMNSPTELDGIPLHMSNQVPLKTLVLGAWREILVGNWGGLDIEIDRSTKSKAGSVTINAFLSSDVAIRHNEAFVVVPGVS